MNPVLMKLLFYAASLPFAFGFTCYRCSYATQTEGNMRDCIEKPEVLGFGSDIECNSTSYCVLQEQYDLHKKLVTSYFRSCSGNTWGNKCDKDWSHITCKASCQGDYCNGNDVGMSYEQYMEEHKDDQYFNTGANVTVKMSSFVFSMLSVFILCML